MKNSCVKDDSGTKVLAVDSPGKVEAQRGAKSLTQIGECITCTDPQQAVALFDCVNPDLVILDLQWPNGDGYDLLGCLRQRAPVPEQTPIMAISPVAELDLMKRALDAGANDVLIAPIAEDEAAVRLANLMRQRNRFLELNSFNEELERKVRERTQELWQSQIEILERLARASEAKDEQTADHSRRVGELAGHIAKQMGMPKTRVALIRLAAPLHDVGKVSVPDHILLKRGSLTVEEMDLMRTHTEVGARILSGGRSPLLALAEVIALTHHERWDGKGYPRGLRGEAIPIEGRIVALADVYDALTTHRPYRKRMSHGDAIAYIISESGTHFDPAVVRAFLQVAASLDQFWRRDAA